MKRKPDIVAVLTLGFFVCLAISSCIEVEHELVSPEQARTSNFAVSIHKS